jgi:hypothetical protein
VREKNKKGRRTQQDQKEEGIKRVKKLIDLYNCPYTVITLACEIVVAVRESSRKQRYRCSVRGERRIRKSRRAHLYP